jgi:hypothetical protein
MKPVFAQQMPSTVTVKINEAQRISCSIAPAIADYFCQFFGAQAPRFSLALRASAFDNATILVRSRLPSSPPSVLYLMLIQFAVSTAMLLLCVFLHGAGLFSLSRAMRSEAAAERLQHIKPLSSRGALFTFSIVVLLFALHGIEIWLYAFVYLSTGAIGSIEEALYFSTISYTTVGFSDTHVASNWRLVAAFESIVGMVLLGWSTAFLFRMLSRIDPH